MKAMKFNEKKNVNVFGFNWIFFSKEKGIKENTSYLLLILYTWIVINVFLLSKFCEKNIWINKNIQKVLEKT